MTVGTHLTNTASELVLNSSEKTSIGTSIATLSTRLDSYFGDTITDHFQFGSNQRGTILPRKADSNSDVDYMVVFSTEDGQKTPQTYLDRLRKFAETKYATSEISQSSPTIVLSLNHIRFELVPAIYSSWSGYQIPSPKSHWAEWMNTNPSEAQQAILEKNNSHNYEIKPLVRLIKYWNAQQGHPFSSYELEKHIVDKFFFLCSTQKDYFYSFWSGFNCSWDTAQYIKDKVERAKSYATQAKSYEQSGMPISAENEIKKIIPTL